MFAAQPHEIGLDRVDVCCSGGMPAFRPCGPLDRREEHILFLAEMGDEIGGNLVEGRGDLRSSGWRAPWTSTIFSAWRRSARCFSDIGVVDGDDVIGEERKLHAAKFWLRSIGSLFAVSISCRIAAGSILFAGRRHRGERCHRNRSRSRTSEYPGRPVIVATNPPIVFVEGSSVKVSRIFSYSHVPPKNL
jgi:hypothetical protein